MEVAVTLAPPAAALALAAAPRPEVLVALCTAAAAAAFREWWPLLALAIAPAVLAANLFFDPSSSAPLASHLEAAARGLDVVLLVFAVVVAISAALPLPFALLTLDLPAARAAALRAAPLPCLLLLKMLAEGRTDAMMTEAWEQASAYAGLVMEWLAALRALTFGKRTDRDTRMHKSGG